jgi:mannose-1-phosphate guanylyltransferase
MLHGIIIAGGSGKRLWPKSRKPMPKFFLKINSRKTLLEESINRIKQIVPLNNILIITNKAHLKSMRKALPGFHKENIIAEPVSRNTAPAIFLAAALVKKKDPGGVIFVIPADQIIDDKPAIKEIFSVTSLMAHIMDSIITIGIKPTFAATGYGYIKIGRLYKRLKGKTAYDVYNVGKFTEKPSLQKAKLFIRSKKYLWNSGMFIGKAEVFLREFKRYKPAIYNALAGIEVSLGTKKQQAAINRCYKNFPDISIDYAIMEKTKKSLVVKTDIALDDIGSWNGIKKYTKQDKNKNSIDANHISIDTKNSVIIGEKPHLIATIGIDNMIIVQTADATLICSGERAEDVKDLVELAEKKALRGRYKWAVS